MSSSSSFPEMFGIDLSMFGYFQYKAHTPCLYLNISKNVPEMTREPSRTFQIIDWFQGAQV